MYILGMKLSWWVTRSVLSVALGSMTALAVAWAAPLAAGAFNSARVKAWSADTLWIDDTHGGHFRVSRGTLADSVSFQHLIFTGAVADLPYYKRTPPPRWAHKLTHDIHGEGPAASLPWWGVDTVATGWPLRAFRGAEYEPWPKPETSAPTINFVIDGTGALKVASPPPPPSRFVGLYRFGGPAGDRFAIPTDILPSGLAINVLAFGLAWFLLLFAWAAFAWSRRRRKGLCRGCGYDLHGLAPGAACPECGMPAHTIPGGHDVNAAA